MSEIKINIRRFKDSFNKLSSFGINSLGGIDRTLGSKADKEAREYISSLGKELLKGQVTLDQVANIWIDIKGEENLKPIVMGSHHDAVPNGGKYDGALGVLLAIEVAKSLQDSGYKFRHPLKIVSFSAEEPNRFELSTLGSRVVSGKLNKDLVLKAKNRSENILLSDVLDQLGGDSANIDKAIIEDNSFAAFIECHIEQGRILFDKGLSVGVVEKITGIYREKVKVIGEANHSGTTVMRDRHDGLVAAAEAVVALETIIKAECNDTVVGTIGKFDIFPNSPNIIPGECDFIMEIRTADEKIKENIIRNLDIALDKISKKRGVLFIRETIFDQGHVDMDEVVIDALEVACKEIKEPVIKTISMAGHDAAHISKNSKTAMLFVQSTDGKSHCPEEYTELKHIEKAGKVLMGAILKLDKELDS